MSQITTISDEKTSLVTKIASVLEPELAKLSHKHDFALDDEARSNQGDSTSVSEPQSKARSNQDEVLGSMMTKLTMSDVK